MRNRRNTPLRASPRMLVGAMAALMASTAMAADVTKARLENADNEPNNWISVFQNYSSHRFSRLNQINRDNVKNLKVAYTVPLTSALVGSKTASLNLENGVLVDDGMLYVDDAWGGIYKIDARPGADEGRIVWFADAGMSKDEDPRTRGIAFWGNNVYKDLVDGRVIAVNRDNGEVVWDKQIARKAHPKGSGLNLAAEGFTSAPLAVEGKILVGQAWGDRATRGFLSAVDAANGNEVWRTYMVPGPGEPGHETWKDDHNAWKTGGGGMWTTGSYDPTQRVTIWGTGQPVPMFDPQFRPGDNLFSNSAVALNIDNGSMKWYFQYTPNESWDYDEQGVHMLYDATVNGEARKVVSHFGRNGFFYQLDRTNGQFLNANQYVEKVTWTAGIDPKTGKPMEYNPALALQTYVPASRFSRGDAAKTACPTLVGGVRWQPPAFNPDRKVIYSGGIDGCFTLQIMASLPIGPEGGIRTDQGGGNNGRGTNIASYSPRGGLITAHDVATGKLVAKLPQKYDNLSGVLATSGGLIFSATMDGAVTAHNDQTLAELWRFNTRISVKAPVVSFSAGGKQFLAVVAGGAKAPQPAEFPELKTMNSGAMLYVFAL